MTDLTSKPVPSHTHTVSGKTTSKNGGHLVYTDAARIDSLESWRASFDAELGDLVARVTALEAPVVVPPPVTPPPVTPPPTGSIVSPGWIGPYVNGTYVMHAGTYRFGFTAAEVATRVSLQPYGDGPVIIDGTGLDPHFVYLGPGADWTIGAIQISGFAPSDSGVIGIGDACKLTMQGTVMRFPNPAPPPTANAAQNRHLVYFHGTGTGLIEDGDFRGAPGAALQSYRGSPVVTVNRGHYEGLYRGALIYSGKWTINDAFIGAAADPDAEYKPGTLTLNHCTGPTGAVRTYVA